MVDQFSRNYVALVVDTSLSGARVARELDAVVVSRGRPNCIASENGMPVAPLLTTTTLPKICGVQSWHCDAAVRPNDLPGDKTTGIGSQV